MYEGLTHKSILYLIISSLSLGLMIGTKGYGYFFIPGFGVFFLYLLKNTRLKEKIRKIFIYSILSLLSILSFCSGTYMQNIKFYDNPLGDKSNIKYLRIKNPNLHTFISTISKTIISFYDMPFSITQNILPFGIIREILLKILNFIHNVLKLDLSSPRTTFPPGCTFNLNQNLMHHDSAYL
jgi:hypothetical protein